MDALPETIREVLNANQEALQTMYDHAVSKTDDGTAPTVEGAITETYEGHTITIDIRVQYTGEPHRLAIRKGHFSVRIEATLDDTAILTDVKPYFYDVHEALFPDIEPVVRQDYPTGTLTISTDITKGEFEAWLLDN